MEVMATRDHQRYSRRLNPEHSFFSVLLVAQVITMVGPQHDDRIASQWSVIQSVDQITDHRIKFGIPSIISKIVSDQGRLFLRKTNVGRAIVESGARNT